MKVMTIVGARPQFVKAAAVSRELRKSHTEILVHTGQHYDYEMSGIFFDGLDIPQPDFNLGIGSGSHGAQTGAMLQGVEELLIEHRPDWLLVYGDTNSTLAGALAASKVHIPIVHVEAGLRSFNRRMPEEVNRVVTDHLSTLLLCPSQTATRNLATEGLSDGVHLVGDVMLDVLYWACERNARTPNTILERFGIESKNYLLATVHRSENTDNPQLLSQILDAFNSIDSKIVFPVHPRARKAIAESGVIVGPNVWLIDPVGYVDMICLANNARMILTDSGGLQKEAYWMRVPCLTLRNETEWVETVATGWNRIVGSGTDAIVEATKNFSPNGTHPDLYGDGSAAAKCIELLQP